MVGLFQQGPRIVCWRRRRPASRSATGSLLSAAFFSSVTRALERVVRQSPYTAQPHIGPPHRTAVSGLMPSWPRWRYRSLWAKPCLFTLKRPTPRVPAAPTVTTEHDVRPARPRTVVADDQDRLSGCAAILVAARPLRAELHLGHIDHHQFDPVGSSPLVPSARSPPNRSSPSPARPPRPRDRAPLERSALRRREYLPSWRNHARRGCPIRPLEPESSR